MKRKFKTEFDTIVDDAIDYIESVVTDKVLLCTEKDIFEGTEAFYELPWTTYYDINSENMVYKITMINRDEDGVLHFKGINVEDDVMTFTIDDLSSDCIVDIASRI